MCLLNGHGETVLMTLVVLEALDVICLSHVKVNDIATLFGMLDMVVYYDWASTYILSVL